MNLVRELIGSTSRMKAFLGQPSFGIRIMHLEHRMRAFQGTSHANPDYALWYGWSEMRRDLTEIKELAEGLRRNHAGKCFIVLPCVRPR